MLSSETLSSLALVGLGGALGSVARYGISLALAQQTTQSFPWATLIVNVVGSFVIGFASTLLAPAAAGGQEHMKLAAFITKGFCGGFTTFSTFSLETYNLFEEGAYGQAGLNVAGSLLCCFIGVWAGIMCAHAIRR